MEYMEEKFALKSSDMKAGDYYMDHVMESLDGAHYFSKSSPKCVLAFGLQGAEPGADQCSSSPCGDRSGACGRAHLLRFLAIILILLMFLYFFSFSYKHILCLQF